MHPAASIIVFTTLSGMALGIVFWTGLGLGPSGGAFPWLVSALALVLGGAGGLASAGHLARPDRAWRAFSQWRSSWLSREACLYVAALGVFALYAAAWCLGGVRVWPLGLLAAGLSVGAVYATAMIYAQLATVPRWSLTPTPQLFLALSGTGGLMAAEGAARLAGAHAADPLWIIVALFLSAGVAVWWQTEAAGAGRRSAGSDIGTATGLGRIGRVKLFEAPHTGSNYLLSEMAFRVGRHRAYQLRLVGAVAGFAAPVALVLAALFLPGGAFWLVLALASHVLGIMALRWLFFAEAEHVQALYYGMR